MGWLVFGVKDKPKQIVGSNYRTNRPHLDSLKEEIANQTSNRLTFEEIHEVARPEGRVVMFQIPPALRGMPTAWKGHFYGRDNEAIGPLSLHEIEHIRKQSTREDWSAEICVGATLNDLDPMAVSFARQEYKKKHPALAHEVDGWDDPDVPEQGKGLLGTFLPGDVEDVIRRDAPFSVYRNPFLAKAMVALQMIDTIGSGIKRIYQVQKKRSFPMPDYDLSREHEVQVQLIGKVLDERYTRLLMARTDLDLWEVIALDKVQKGRPLTDDEFKLCKRKKLVEGRRANLFVSAAIAAATETKAEYIKKRGFDKEHYKKLVTAYLMTFDEAKREDIDKLLMDKLSDSLDEGQRRNFIHNLLQEMRKDGVLDRARAQSVEHVASG